jgi:hypothetical protein
MRVQLVFGIGLLLLNACEDQNPPANLLYGQDISKINPAVVKNVKDEMKMYPSDVIDLPFTKTCSKFQAASISRSGEVDLLTANFVSIPVCTCTTFALREEPQYADINRKATEGMDYLKILEAHQELLPKIKHCGGGVKFEDVCSRDLLSSLSAQHKDGGSETKLKANCVCAMDAFLKLDQTLAFDFMLQTLKGDSFLKTLANPKFQQKYVQASKECKN